MYKINEMYDLTHTKAEEYLKKYEYPWEALNEIKNIIIEIGKNLDRNEYKEIKENVWVHKSAQIFSSAYIDSPCIIDAETEVRHCAFIRGSALIGKNCVIGNSTELKNVIIFDNVQVPHYNYVGDSILGYKSHMGAGSITSNVKSDKTLVTIKDNFNNITLESGIKKVGAMLGDYVEIGCNSVLNPGTVIGRNTSVYPLSSIRGVIPENSIYKNKDNVVKKEI